jgi:protein-tyrosine phosphatase
VPSGDDGVRSEAEGLELVREAGRRGTAVLYGTPHVTAFDPLTPERRHEVERHWLAMAAPAAAAGVDLQLGWELGPHEELLSHDLADLRLGSLQACLLELPLPHFRHRDLRLTMRCVDHLEEAGMQVVIAHPERCDLVPSRPQVLDELVDRGCLLQVNATSLLGYHGPECERTGWALVEDGRCSFVASDGHRAARPPFLDEAFTLVAASVGDGEARRLFEGHALAAIPRAAQAPARGRA